MFGKFTAYFAFFAVAVFLSAWNLSGANPAIGDRMQHRTTYDNLEICIENCAQCKKMLGAWFDGPLCADSCIKFKVKLIPECEDFSSIAPFLNKL